MASTRLRMLSIAKSFLGWTLACVVACALFIVNRVLVASVYALVDPGAGRDPSKIRMFVLLLVPIALLVPEWWVLDAIRSGLGKWRRRRD